MERRRIGVDFDDTPVKSNEAVVRWHNETYGTDHRAGPGCYDLAVLWNVPRFEVERRFLEYVESTAHDKAEAMPYAVEALQILGQHFDVDLVTGRRENTELRTRNYLSAVFPGVFNETLFTGHFDPDPAKRRTKGDVAKERGYYAFIEDWPEHAETILLHAPDTRVILIDTIWNQGFTHPRVERVTSWLQIPKLLL